MASIEVANPVAESFTASISPAVRPDRLDGLRIGLYWNFKPGGNIGLDRVQQILAERYPAVSFVRGEGSAGASVRHLTPNDADQLAASVDVVVGTTGD